MCSENLIWNLALLSLVTSTVQKSKVQKNARNSGKRNAKRNIRLMRDVYRFNIVWNVTIDWISVSAEKYSAG